MSSFRALRVHNEDGKISSRLEDITLDDLPAGEVVIKAAWSDINFKDALAVTGTGKIMKRFPMVAGIDVSGQVSQSTDPRFKEGDDVLVVGCGMGEVHDGGYADYVRVPADWVVPLPAGLSPRESMQIGTAGFTAGMAVQRMEENGQTPGHGTILVNGASGGVGSLAITMFAGLGYDVTALTSKASSTDYLKSLGAKDVLIASEVDMGSRPLEKSLWGGAVDNLGGETLAWMTRTIEPFGNIAAIGLASGIKLDTTVMPFILRGVNLLGINSTYCPLPLREKVWERLASDIKPGNLDTIASREVALADSIPVFADLIDNKVTGRMLIRI